jgi:hypothetical protein
MTSELSETFNFLAASALALRCRVIGISVFSRLVQADVICKTHQFKILNSIIERVFIYVMNNLRRLQRPSEVFLHRPSMFPFRYPIFHYHPVTVAERPRMVRSLSERTRISAFLPSLIVLNAITLYVVRTFTFFEGAFSFVFTAFTHGDEVYT